MPNVSLNFTMFDKISSVIEIQNFQLQLQCRIVKYNYIYICIIFREIHNNYNYEMVLINYLITQLHL